MKKLLPFFIVIIFFSSDLLIAQQSIFSKKYIGFPSLAGYNIIQAYDNSFMIAGEDAGLPMVMKTDSAGNYLWGMNYGTSVVSAPPFDINTRITPTNDSNFVFVTNYYNVTDSMVELLYVKINQSGDTLWSSIVQDTVVVYPYSIEQTYDHGFITTGYSNHSGTPYNRIMVVKTDSAGNLQWRKTLTPGNYNNMAYAVQQTPDSGYVLISYIENLMPNQQNTVLIKLSETGNQQWAMAYNRQVPTQSGGIDLEITSSGIVSMISLAGGLSFMKTDFSGNVMWLKSYYYNVCTGCYGASFRLNKTYDGGFVANIGIGVFGNLSTLKIDSMGNYKWSNSVWNLDQEVIETKDSGYIALGNGPILLVGPRTTNYLWELALVKTDSVGYSSQCVTGGSNALVMDSIMATPITVTETSGGTSSRYYPAISIPVVTSDYGCIDVYGKVNELHLEDDISVYPNPASSWLTIESKNFKIEKIKMTDVLGNQIRNYELGMRNDKSVIIDLSGVAKGIYFIQITDETKNVVNKKMVLQ